MSRPNLARAAVPVILALGLLVGAAGCAAQRKPLPLPELPLDPNHPCYDEERGVMMPPLYGDDC